MMSQDRHSTFIPGLELSGRFYRDVVSPILRRTFPGLNSSAALIGYGSEVLGYDTARSTDHEWGPRLLLFLGEEDHAAYAAAIDAALANQLPATFLGYSTHFGPPGPDGARLPVASDGGAIAHKIEIHSPRPWLTAWLGVDPFADLTAVDWLLIPQQKLLEVTAGRVYHDGLGLLEPLRARLAWYPDDLWRYLIAAQWGRISQGEAFVGRAGEVGDELGSALVTAALVRDLMALCFLIERRYAPYAKWFGTGFAELACGPRLMPFLLGALQATSWRERERFLSPAYEAVAEMHNALGISAPVDPGVRPYHSRPFQVLHAERFVAALDAAVTDAEVRQIIARVGWIGAVDQISDNTDVLSDPKRYVTLRA